MDSTRTSCALGLLAGGQECYGVFAVDNASSKCFTAWQPCEWSDPLKANRYLEKAVPLEVDVKHDIFGVPNLTTRKWVAGLHFTEHMDQKAVLLPWAAFMN